MNSLLKNKPKLIALTLVSLSILSSAIKVFGFLSLSFTNWGLDNNYLSTVSNVSLFFAFINTLILSLHIFVWIQTYKNKFSSFAVSTIYALILLFFTLLGFYVETNSRNYPEKSVCLRSVNSTHTKSVKHEPPYRIIFDIILKNRCTNPVELSEINIIGIDNNGNISEKFNHTVQIDTKNLEPGDNYQTELEMEISEEEHKSVRGYKYIPTIHTP